MVMGQKAQYSKDVSSPQIHIQFLSITSQQGDHWNERDTTGHLPQDFWQRWESSSVEDGAPALAWCCSDGRTSTHPMPYPA